MEKPYYKSINSKINEVNTRDIRKYVCKFPGNQINVFHYEKM